jgi:hypothetical protein
LGVVAVPFLRNLLAGVQEEATFSMLRELRIVRRVSEDEVISEFLKNDSQSPEFEDYREALDALVTKTDLNSATENVRRRALLFLRHGALWRELPEGTDWYEVQLRAPDLERIRVFPRAQWRKLARGNFAITQVLRSLRSGRSYEVADQAFLSKIVDLGTWLTGDVDAGAVLLIGVTERGPMTILDGNHRLVAAALNSSETLQRFRFFCGLSPNMAQCCWYKTNLATLCHYGLNLLRHLVHDPEAELSRLLRNPSS